MLDNLREDADLGSGFDDEFPDFLDELEEESEKKAKPSGASNPVKQMTSVQRFIIAVLLFMLVCLVGSMLLLVSGKFMIL